MKKTREEAQKTREQLIQSGYIIFLRKGFDAATLEDVVRECGLTRGSAYYHFSNKAELYKTVVRMILDRIHESKIAIIHDDSLNITNKLTGLLSLPILNKDDYRLVNRSVELSKSHSEFSDLGKDIRKAKDDFYVLLTDLLRQNGYKEAAVLADTFYYLFEGFYFSSEEKEISKEEVARIVSLLTQRQLASSLDALLHRSWNASNSL